MTKQTRPGPALWLAMTVIAAAYLAGIPARAQEADLRGLSEELLRLNNDIKDIQLFIYKGEGPAASITNAGAAEAQAASDAIAGRMEVKFGEVGDQFRSLTGQIEEISYRISQLTERVEKLVNDVDFRLNAIEQAQAEALANAVPQIQQAAPAQQAAGGTAQPPAPGTLGTLSTLALGEAPTDNGVLAPPPQPAPALPAGTVKQQYDYAFSLLRQQEYAEAERALTAFIDAHPRDELAGNANYWLAETYYVRGDFRKAAGYFAAGYKNFPEGGKASDNLLKLAMSLANLDEKDKACFTFKELSERYPDAPPAIKQRAAFESQRAGCG